MRFCSSKAALLVVAALTAASSPCRLLRAADACDRAPLLVRGAKVWNANGPAAVRDVLFADGRVARVAGTGSIEAPPAARVLDGRGQTLLPGLIDLHAHLGVPGGLPPADPPAPERNWQISGRQLLRSGVTSVRTHMTSSAGRARVLRDAADPCAPLPRLHFSGPELAGGTPETGTPNFASVKDAADAAAKVRQAAAAGFEWISVGDAGKFRAGELAALSEAARHAGVRLMAPVNDARQMAALLSAGVATIDDIDTTPAPRYPDALMQQLRTVTAVTLVPTIGYPFRVHACEHERKRLDAPSNYEFMTAGEKAFVAATARSALANDPYIVNNRRVYATLSAKFRQLRASGVPMATGTDVGSATHFHAGAIWWELQAWRAFGAHPHEALVAATASAARVLGDDRAGAIEPGDHADFVLYAGDAEDGAFALERVRAVAKDGILFVRDGAWIGPARAGAAP